ncbi:MAG TPA: universal stress protein UspA [Dehalococcoidia bacterium]|nr:universal stress protein UspA [Dehalococcoidia bacterium]
MNSDQGPVWRPKPGDKIIRRPRIKAYPLRRVLGIPALYSAGYGNVGSSIYYALGVIALAAMGATPIVLGIAGIFFIFTALTYAEGTALLPEAGGSSSFARQGGNDLTGFISGWALMLSYIVTIAISAFTIPPYLGYFWEPFKNDPAVGTFVAMGIVGFLMLINVVGIKETSFLNIAAAVLDLCVQLLIIVLGLIFVFNLDKLMFNITNYWPSTENLFLGIALAAIAYTGVETMSQMAEETKQPAKRVPAALILMVITVLLLFSGISTVGFSTMTPAELSTEWATDPIAGIAFHIAESVTPEDLAARLSSEPEFIIIFKWVFNGIRNLLPGLVAVLAATILLIATNAGLMGISRLAFSLGRYQLVPPMLSRIHKRFKTPYFAIILFSSVAILILIPSLFAKEGFLRLGTLYAFGSLLSFTFAHAAIIGIRIKHPDWHRPFKLRGNITIKNREIPLTAVLGLLGTLATWLVLVYTQPYTRLLGFLWIGIGIIVYIVFRRRNKLSIGGTAKKSTHIQVRDDRISIK